MCLKINNSRRELMLVEKKNSKTLARRRHATFITLRTYGTLIHGKSVFLPIFRA